MGSDDDGHTNYYNHPNARRCDTVPVAKLDASEGRNSHGAMLPREVLVWALSALTQIFRIPFDEKRITGQMPPPYGVSSIVHAADLRVEETGCRVPGPAFCRFMRAAQWSRRPRESCLP